MLSEKINLDIEDVEKILNGRSPLEKIRYIDVNFYNTKVNLFIKDENNNTFVQEDKYKPFIWFKGFDFDEHFCWKYYTCYKNNWDAETQTALIFDQLKTVSDTFVFVGESINGNEFYFKEFLPKIQDRKNLCFAKIKEYNVQIKEQITGLDQNSPVSRLENGFKYLVHILEPEEEKFYKNGFIGHTNEGKSKKISGSYTNLVDFFKEGGIDVWKKSGIFLDLKNFFDFWKNASEEKRLIYFISCPIKSLLFNYKFKITDDNEEEDDDNQTTIFINKVKIIEFVKTKIDQNLNAEECLHFLEKEIIHETFNHNDIKLFFSPIKIDEVLLQQLIVDEPSFEGKKNFQEYRRFITEKISYDVYFGEERLFYTLPPLEQYMIQSGNRLFKGMEDYCDLNVLTMDIETKAQIAFIKDPNAALTPERGQIFKIGCMTTKGFEVVLNSENPQEEIKIIQEFFEILKKEDPDLIITYNGEGFDYPFIIKRVMYLLRLKDEDEAIEVIRNWMADYFEKFETYLSPRKFFNRKLSNLKTGGTSEKYLQTNILGTNVCDTMFAVKRAAAINKSIPNFKLKDNIKHAKLNKVNRVYIQGDKIGITENSKSDFYLNQSNGDWFKFEKNINFIATLNSNLLKKKGLDSIYYNDENILYVWDDRLDGELLCEAKNAIKFNSKEISEQYISDFFSNLYEKFANYDTVCFQINHIGLYLKEEYPKMYYVLKGYLKDLRQNTSNVSKFFPDKKIEDYTIVSGSEIVRRYLIDDLWETIKLDEYYSQATFLISKWLPTSYQRTATMGGASVWKLLLSTYSYEYGIAIPEFDAPREFSGGLVALFSCGFHGQSWKGDFSSLYPACFHVHTKSPEIDLFGIYKLFMYYGWQTRIKYKKLMSKHNGEGDFVMGKKFEIKQLPIKILINSFYGMMGAASVTPFADILVAEGITCSGRQWLRLLIKWFNERGFIATIAHTDGVFFSNGTGNLEYTYTGKGLNWLVTEGKDYVGIAAYVAEFNDLFMKGIMGLDIDDVVESVINFAKGNYFYFKYKTKKETGEKIPVLEIVGGAIVKKSQSQYITDFVENNMMLLMQSKSKDFISKYFDTIADIWNYKIPIKTIVSKAKNKKNRDEYIMHIKGKNKNGQPLNRQVHMELLVENNIDFEVGDFTYYVNTGKSHTDKDSKSMDVVLGEVNCEFLSIDQVTKIFKSENRKSIKQLILSEFESGNLIVNKKLDGDLHSNLENLDKCKNVKFKIKILKKASFIQFIKTDFVINCSLVDITAENKNIQYNRELYVDKFISALKRVFICFNEETREKILSVKDTNRPFLLESDFELINGVPFKGHENIQMTFEESDKLSNQEKSYWTSIGKSENDFMTVEI